MSAVAPPRARFTRTLQLCRARAAGISVASGRPTGAPLDRILSVADIRRGAASQLTPSLTRRALVVAVVR